ncbi:hypothetical protein GOP47_0010086 [Adiantum capillus-veneris]|uniref:Mini-chromosome maintenance complex-binding protein n=1 Tax=Adiantum capillus-veneris TaxID=13818 RepID=A0A9D4ZID2_ADICA|nr:hypothetical protein GOP47_0010086 [Adiantum capillus-veneris]
MVGKAYDCVANPLGAVRFLFDKVTGQGPIDGHSSDWGVHPLFSKTVLEDGALSQVPEINAGPLDTIPIHSLVRFRGMVQDMFNVDYYVGAYKDGDVWRTTKYSDVAVVPPCSEANMRIWDRRPLYCVPVPGENLWVKNAFNLRDSQIPVSPANGDASMNQKRAREEFRMNIEDMDTDLLETNEGPAENKRSCRGATTSNGEAKSPSLEPHDLNIPLGEKNLVPCVVKIYDGLDADLKLNDIVEFFGVLTFDPELTRHHAFMGEILDGVQEAFLDEDISSQLPASKVPRLHSIFHRKLSRDNLFRAMPRNAPECIDLDAFNRSSFAELRTSLVARLTEIFGGDGLAAEYLLLHLLSRVHARVEPMAVGKLSLNIVESSASREGVFLPATMVSQAIAALLPRSHLMPLSLEFLNEKPIAPRKNYSSNRLVTGDLQLAEGTHLMLDETALKSGQLTEIGLQNVQFLKNLMEWQKVEYDFEFYKMEMPADVPVLVLSTARSRLFPADVVLPLRPTLNFSSNLSPDLVAKWRTYLGAARAGDHTIDPSIQKILEEDLVTARQEDRSIGPEVFHRWLTMARLLSVSYGESTLSLERWQMVRELERRLAERLRVC